MFPFLISRFSLQTEVTKLFDQDCLWCAYNRDAASHVILVDEQLRCSLPRVGVRVHARAIRSNKLRQKWNGRRRNLIQPRNRPGSQAQIEAIAPEGGISALICWSSWLRAVQLLAGIYRWLVPAASSSGPWGIRGFGLLNAASFCSRTWLVLLPDLRYGDIFLACSGIYFLVDRETLKPSLNLLFV